MSADSLAAIEIDVLEAVTGAQVRADPSMLVWMPDEDGHDQLFMPWLCDAGVLCEIHPRLRSEAIGCTRRPGHCGDHVVALDDGTVIGRCPRSEMEQHACRCGHCGRSLQVEG